MTTWRLAYSPAPKSTHEALPKRVQNTLYRLRAVWAETEGSPLVFLGYTLNPRDPSGSKPRDWEVAQEILKRLPAIEVEDMEDVYHATSEVFESLEAARAAFLALPVNKPYY